MSIFYSVITKATETGLVNLCSYDAAHGNYPTITDQIFSELKIIENTTYKFNEKYNYHVLKDGILIFVCLADSSLKIKTAMTFLSEIRRKFKEKFSNEEIVSATSFELSSKFADIYKNQNFFNSTKDEDKKEILIQQLSSLQEKMSENIQKVIQREQKLEITVKKTARIDTIADQIRKGAMKIKKQAFFARHKCKLLIAGAIIAAAGGFVFII